MKRHVRMVMGATAATLVLATAPMANAAGSGTSASPLYKSYAWVPAASTSQSRAKLETAKARQVALNQRYHGSGSYICSPSGFGSKSRCFAR